MADTLLPLRAAGTSSAAYTAGYTPMMLNSAVKTVFTCAQASVIPERLFSCAVAQAEPQQRQDVPALRRSRQCQLSSR